MNSEYRTIACESQGLFKEKGSKFIAYAIPVGHPEQVHHHLERIRKIHHKARHHCYAYVLGAEGLEERAYDDGEPKHSAGDPILGQLRSFKLTGVLLLVVRYFGGTKLGVGGLVNAYREAAKSALQAAKVVKKEISYSLVLTFAYPEMNAIMRLINELDLGILEQNFGLSCSIAIKVPYSKMERVSSEISKLSSVKVEESNIDQPNR